VHVLWTSWLGKREEKPYPEAVDAIVYRCLEDDGWTEAVDVLTTAQMGPLGIGSVAVDDRDVLNLLWYDQGLSRDLYLSQAHTSEAERGNNWTTTTIDVPQKAVTGPDLFTGSDGRMDVVYALDQNSIAYLTSTGYGRTWSAPVVVWGITNPDVEAVVSPRIAVDALGYVHVVWTVNTRGRYWGPEAVWYARSTDGGETWDAQVMYQSLKDESTVGWIGVAVRNGNEIHLAWNRGIGSQRGRYHTWSPDSGETWREPESFLPEFVSGQTQWPLMATDSAGNLHLVTVAGGPPEPQGTSDSTRPRHSYWNGNNWSEMYTFPESTGDLNVAFAIGLGNQLHVVHESDRFRGHLLYNTKTVDAPPAQAQLIQPPLPTAAATSPGPESAPTRQAEPTPRPSVALNAPVPPPGSGPGDLAIPVALAVLPVVFLVGIVAFVKLGRR
jgi:hypothetical protein